MKSITKEFFRFGDTPGNLEEKQSYLSVTQNQPVTNINLNFSPKEFLEKLGLFQSPYDVSPRERKKAAKSLSDEIRSLLSIPSTRDQEILQLDLVISAAELWAIPFELMMYKDGKPIFANPNRKIVLTRRIRQEFADREYQWFSKLNILFVWASAGDKKESEQGTAVPNIPFLAHKEALEKALESWIPPLSIEGKSYENIPDSSEVLKVIKECTFDELRNKLKEARNAGEPFSHVHILAHGVETKDENKQPTGHYGVGLYPNKEGEITTANDLARLFEDRSIRPQVVTLAICDSANQSNSVVPKNSLVQAIHKAGVPVVIGSQFPLEKESSTIFFKEFYLKLLKGADVREALHDARVELNTAKKNDWASIVAYVQLAEGYTDHLVQMRNNRQLSAFKITKRYADSFLTNWTDDEELQEIQMKNYEIVTDKVRTEINNLRSFIRNSSYKNIPTQQEANGLMASYYKTLAELLFKVSKKNEDKMTKLNFYLRIAKAYYKRGNKLNILHHWTGVQILSIEAILTGKISNKNNWETCLSIAKHAAQNQKEYWAYGTILELYLLAPLVGEKFSEEEIKEVIETLIERVVIHAPDFEKEDIYFPLKSTRLQMKRYTDWWTSENGYFTKDTDRKDDAISILEYLNLPEEEMFE